MNQERLKIIYEGDWQTPIPDEIINAGVILSHGAYRFWTVLRRFAEADGDEYGIKKCYPSIKTIAEKMGISTVQAHQYKKQLEEIGLVLIKKKIKEKGFGVINVYRMIDPKLWLKSGGDGVRKNKKNMKSKSYKKQSQTLKKYADSTD